MLRSERRELSGKIAKVSLEAGSALVGRKMRHYFPGMESKESEKKFLGWKEDWE